MSAKDVIAEIEALPPRERARVFKHFNQAKAADEAEIPESFKQGMADATAGRFADMETVLSGAKPPARRRKWVTATSPRSVFGKVSTR